MLGFFFFFFFCCTWFCCSGFLFAMVATPLSAAPDAAARLRPRLPTLHTKLDANHGHDSVAPPESRGALAAWDCYHGSA
eukprot:COSAG03_NODE_9735_length_697_cov_0.729097_1_plen_79_part_00